ncbi:MAG TPA: Asp-tRNA(Asn)/Glu-tRNA(Gln) amidotransferase subunit GatB [Bacillota bacterium]|jgi:aspartyl-tRNA(Asn)/glutamyl-tRNA(Gln) amidotransferase subunit B
MTAELETVIGVEVHVELSTKTKIFCGCPTTFGAEPNTHVCPICLGMPGSLPVLNEAALEDAVKAALVLGCQVAQRTKFDRKNYFYPDLPKGYQISQFDQPVATGGLVEFEVDGEPREVRIHRVHLEEDAGKSLHDAAGDSTLVDFNRTGVPLIEIVSEPDLRSPEEARVYLIKLKSLIEYTGVSDVKMEEGSLRCDCNVSVHSPGTEFGTPVELKNLNSFRSVRLALDYEVERQKKVIAEGGTIIRETRLWDERAGQTRSMRAKEQSHDYRYFPEPDLVPFVIDRAWVEKVRRGLPEMPAAKRDRYVRDWGLPPYDAGVITGSPILAAYFERCATLAKEPKKAANWIMGELMAHLNAKGLGFGEIPISPEHLVGLIDLIDRGVISGTIAKSIFPELCATGREPEVIVRERGLSVINDEGAIVEAVERAIADNPKAVAEIRGGKDRAMGFLVGQVMKATKGRANPELVNKLVREKLSQS